MTIETSSAQVSRDTLALLSFDFLKQLTTLSLAAAGGAITLLETAFSEHAMKPVVFVAVALLFLAAVLSLQAQQILVERLSSTQEAITAPSRLRLPRTQIAEKHTTVVAFILFGSGVGALLVALFYR